LLGVHAIFKNEPSSQTLYDLGTPIPPSQGFGEKWIQHRDLKERCSFSQQVISLSMVDSQFLFKMISMKINAGYKAVQKITIPSPAAGAE
jgi:hypothetical protein